MWFFYEPFIWVSSVANWQTSKSRVAWIPQPSASYYWVITEMLREYRFPVDCTRQFRSESAPVSFRPNQDNYLQSPPPKLFFISGRPSSGLLSLFITVTSAPQQPWSVIAAIRQLPAITVNNILEAPTTNKLTFLFQKSYTLKWHFNTVMLSVSGARCKLSLYNCYVWPPISSNTVSLVRLSAGLPAVPRKSVAHDHDPLPHRGHPLRLPGQRHHHDAVHTRHHQVAPENTPGKHAQNKLAHAK